MKFFSLFDRSVDAAVRSVSVALARLEKAEAKHASASEVYVQLANAAQDMALEEAAKADRAGRIKTKLADLLA